MTKQELIQMPVNKETLETLRKMIYSDDDKRALWMTLAADVRAYIYLPVAVKKISRKTMKDFYETIEKVKSYGYSTEVPLLGD